MPELPEVEVVRRQLQDAVVGKTIAAVEVFHPKTVAGQLELVDVLPNKTIANIDRVGKLLIFSFIKQPDLFLLAHLKMTGQFFYVEDSNVITGGGHSMTAADLAEFPGRHTRVAVYFQSGSTLYFNDQRLFGYIKLADQATVATARSGFGPEPTDPEFNLDWFVKRVRQRKSIIKAVLLDQSFIAGIGNIYADEALWRAQIRPTRRAHRLTKSEARKLAQAAGAVMNESIKAGGTTFQNFKDTGGRKGNFVDLLDVFGKQNTPCPRCGTLIKKNRTAGRGTHYCPNCQT